MVDRVQPVRALFENAPPSANYGFAFADLTGQYAVTARFLEATKHIALVAVHDFGRTGCDGVEKAVREFIRFNRRTLRRVGTLIILEVAGVL